MGTHQQRVTWTGAALGHQTVLRTRLGTYGLSPEFTGEGKALGVRPWLALEGSHFYLVKPHTGLGLLCAPATCLSKQGKEIAHFLHLLSQRPGGCKQGLLLTPSCPPPPWGPGRRASLTSFTDKEPESRGQRNYKANCQNESLRDDGLLVKPSGGRCCG